MDVGISIRFIPKSIRTSTEKQMRLQSIREQYIYRSAFLLTALWLWASYCSAVIHGHQPQTSTTSAGLQLALNQQQLCHTQTPLDTFNDFDVFKEIRIYDVEPYCDACLDYIICLVQLAYLSAPPAVITSSWLCGHCGASLHLRSAFQSTICHQTGPNWTKDICPLISRSERPAERSLDAVKLEELCYNRIWCIQDQ